MSSPWSATAVFACLRVINPRETRWLARGLEFQSAVGIHECFL